jgi:hypothetical protein
MEVQTTPELTGYEKKLIAIIRRLPPDQLPYLVEFAHFLEFRAAKTRDAKWIEQDEADFGIQEELADEAKWDELFGKPEAKRLTREMAREARAEYRAGNTTEIQITEDGRLAPK